MSDTQGGQTGGEKATTTATGNIVRSSNNNNINTDSNDNNDQPIRQDIIRDHKKEIIHKDFTGKESNVGAVLGIRI